MNANHQTSPSYAHSLCHDLSYALIERDLDEITNALLAISCELWRSYTIHTSTFLALQLAIRKIPFRFEPPPSDTPKLDLRDLQTEALALAGAIHRRDTVAVADSLGLLYEQMADYGVLHEHALQLIVLLRPETSLDKLIELLQSLPYSRSDTIPPARPS